MAHPAQVAEDLLDGKELLCLDHNTSEGRARILALQNEHSSILQMKDNAVADALASADK